MERSTTARNPSYWKKRTWMEKCLLILFILAVIVIISLLVAIQTIGPATELAPSTEEGLTGIPLHNQSHISSTCPRGDKICITPGCIRAAGNVLESIDKSIEPCDDFYRFACGNYINSAIIPDDKTSVTTFTVLNDQLQERLRTVLEEPVNDNESNAIQKVKNYYQACINKKNIENSGLEILKDILEQAGGWPVLKGTTWDDDNFDWKKLMYKFSELGFDSSIFIELTVGTDLKNSSTRCIQLDQPELGLTREFLVKGFNGKHVNAYFNYMVDVAMDFGCDKATAEKELKESLEFEMQLANFSMPKEDRRNISKLYNVMSVSDLQQNYTGIPWLQFINNLLPPEMSVDAKESLILISPSYVSSLIELIKHTPKRVQANFAIWRAIKSQILYLNENVRSRKLEYNHVISGITEEQTRWKECVDEVATSLPILASAVYIRKYFQEDAKSNAVEMVKYIKDSFKNILKSLDWMEEVTRKSALEKAGAVVDHIGYPDELLDDKKLEKYYKTLEVYPDQYLKSHLNIEIHNIDFAYRRLREPVNKTDWVDHGNVAQVNAFYHPLENSIMFPAGILQGSFFGKDRPRYMNFAAIGSVIGHELTHGFDDTGRQFDKDGNLVDWWEQKTKEAFLQKAECIINQYGNYTVPETFENLNGVNTQGENIADNGGIKEAYLAYQAWVENNSQEARLPGLDYSPNQLFWISGAMNWCARYRPEVMTLLVATDSHPLNEFRVLGPFSNLEHFARDFNCPLGSKMNPQNKCSVW